MHWRHCIYVLDMKYFGRLILVSICANQFVSWRHWIWLASKFLVPILGPYTTFKRQRNIFVKVMSRKSTKFFKTWLVQFHQSTFKLNHGKHAYGISNFPMNTSYNVLASYGISNFSMNRCGNLFWKCEE